MKPDFLPEAVTGVPSGLIACRIGNTAYHIVEISPRSLLLRSPEPIPDVSAQLSLLDPERGCYNTYTIHNFQIGEARRSDGAVLTRFLFDDPDCAAAIRNTLNAYARYIEIKSAHGPAAYARYLSGYPEEEEESFPSSLPGRYKSWFRDLPPLPRPPAGVSLALSLNCPELWKLYLAQPIEAFMEAYAAARFLYPGQLPFRRPDRLYLGNPFCRLLFPDLQDLQSIARKARSEGLALTLVTAELRGGEEDHIDALLSFAAENGAELEVNDWGVLERAQAFRNQLPLLLGSMLNRRRKDPRMPWKSGFSENPNLFSSNAQNDPAWRSFLSGMGVRRLEYESCSLPTRLPPIPCSLHLPFYQTNTALWCPLRALADTGDRGTQRPSESCPLYCEQNALLYPRHLNMLGRWNSLLALDRSAWSCPPDGYDRWVLNL